MTQGAEWGTQMMGVCFALIGLTTCALGVMCAYRRQLHMDNEMCQIEYDLYWSFAIGGAWAGMIGLSHMLMSDLVETPTQGIALGYVATLLVFLARRFFRIGRTSLGDNCALQQVMRDHCEQCPERLRDEETHRPALHAALAICLITGVSGCLGGVESVAMRQVAVETPTPVVGVAVPGVTMTARRVLPDGTVQEFATVTDAEGKYTLYLPVD